MRVIHIHKKWAVVCGLAVLTGCTPEYYRESADRQVKQILEDRKQDALGYKPKTEALTTVSAQPQKRAYDIIPVTPLPPPRSSVMERDVVILPYGPLGPSNEIVPQGLRGPQPDIFGVAASEESAARRNRLGPPAPGEQMHRLDLFRSITYAVNHNRDYQSRAETLYLTTLDVTLQRHNFEPQPFVTQSFNYDGGQQDAGYVSALSAVTTAGVSQKLPYGGKIVASTLVKFVDALNHNSEGGESADLVLSASIPLLRGAGLVNLEGLINSERQLVYEVRAFESFRRTFAVTVASAYFRLLTSQQAVANRRQNYRNLSTLTDRTKALYSNGKITFLEVQQALQAQLTADSALLDAQETLAAALDDFKVTLGMNVEDDLEVVPVELNLQVPDIDREDYVANATRFRLDLQTDRDQIDDARRGVSNAANGLLPDIELTASGDVGNRGATPAKSLDARTSTYSAGLSIDLPVDRLAERNQYRRSLIGLEQAMRNYVTAQQQVVSDSREIVRRLRLDEMTLQVQNRAIELAQRRVEYSNELLALGTANSRDVVESQQALLTAQDNYDRARADLQIQVLKYLNATGTLRLDPTGGEIALAMEKKHDDELRLDPADVRPKPKIQ